MFNTIVKSGGFNLRLNNFIKKLKNDHEVNEVENTETSDLESSSIIRKKIVFSGKVQGVGFRYEIYVLAEEMNLTGWVRNKNRDRVVLEVQGEKSDISFLISHMKSLKRAVVAHVEIYEVPLINGERGFIVKRG